jgi:four helix bundle protein
MTKIELQDRTKRFAIRVFALIDALPRSAAGRICANQLGRAGSAVAANYRAACRARSRREFVAKIGIVEEEADESEFWLDFITSTTLLPTQKVGALRQEAEELRRIMAASRMTARRAELSSIRQSAIGNRQSK